MTNHTNVGLDSKGLENYILSTLNIGEDNTQRQQQQQQHKQQQKLKKSCLILLKSLLQFQPNSISGLISKLILIPQRWDGGSSSSSTIDNQEKIESRCLCCQRCTTKQSDLTGLLQLVHHKNRDCLEESSSTTASSIKYQDEKKVTMSCLAMISG